jgi:inorganic pyrophosphatase
MVDNGETDTKLIGVIDCDPRWKEVQNLNDLAPHELDVIKDFFETYKRLQKKNVLVNKLQDREWAIKDYEACVDLMTKYKNLSKEEFIAKMKKLHPDKYIG